MSVGSRIQFRTDGQNNVCAFGLKRVRLSLVQFHDDARHRGSRLMQRVSHHAHAIEINGDMPLLANGGVGQFQHQAVGMNPRDHRRFDCRVQRDLDTHIFSGVRDLHILEACESRGLRSCKRHQ